jgi:glycine cleavage system aminomethyltransferase T
VSVENIRYTPIEADLLAFVKRNKDFIGEERPQSG